jgi:hypothetical protein
VSGRSRGGTIVAGGTSVVPADRDAVSVVAGRIVGPVVELGGRTRRRSVRVAMTR